MMKSCLHSGVSRRLAGRLIWVLIPLTLGNLGCQDYRWRWDYQKAEQDARQQNKYLFVFYKWWLSDESNRMHGEVMPDPKVGALFQDTVNLLLERDSSPAYAEYMTKYGISTPPAFVIVAPDGSYDVKTGFVPKDRFIEFVEKAKSRQATTDRAPPSR